MKYHGKLFGNGKCDYVNNAYSAVRSSALCPNCLGGKSVGDILCLPCHRRLKNLHNGGYGERMEEVLETLEHDLEFVRFTIESLYLQRELRKRLPHSQILKT